MSSESHETSNGKGSFTSEDEVALRDSLKRCSEATVEAAIEFRKNKDTSRLPVVVLGIIERFVEPELQPKLREADDDLRVIEDLGLDSLTMMEVVILVEEVLQISINNDELRNLRTVGDIKLFIDHKVRGVPPPQPSRFVPVEELGAIMPQQPPFLFLQEATLSPTWATGKYRISGDEHFLSGHFKDNPVFPASILLEALGQLAVLYLLSADHPQLEGKIDPKMIYFTGCEGVRCHRICKPGDVLKLTVKPKRFRMPLATFEGSIRVGQEKAVFADEITLTFGYLSAEAAVAEKPADASEATEKDVSGTQAAPVDKNDETSS